MLARPAASGVTGQQHSVPFHQPVDVLGVDLGQTVEPAPAKAGIGRVSTERRIGKSPSRVCGPRLGRVPFTRSAMLERATPSVSVTVFIGNRPAAQSWTARSGFARASSSASLRISTSMVLRPNSHSDRAPAPRAGTARQRERPRHRPGRLCAPLRSSAASSGTPGWAKARGGEQHS